VYNERRYGEEAETVLYSRVTPLEWIVSILYMKYSSISCFNIWEGEKTQQIGVALYGFVDVLLILFFSFLFFS
jgi:hypothetical protein